jgi:hypothetical protein
MGSEVFALNVVECNPYLPQPFVFTEVAVCLRDAIRRYGLRSEHLVNRIDPNAHSIILCGTQAAAHSLEHLDPARCAIFNLEQLGSGSRLAGPDYVQWLADWKVVDYHSRNVEYLRRANGPGQQVWELPIVPSASLRSENKEHPSVDVLFYGTPNDRRASVLRELESMGLNVETVAGAYGLELAPAVRRARLVLHIHFYDTGLFPVARMLQPAAMGVPVVCETAVMSPLSDWSTSGVVFADHDQLARTCRQLLEDPERMRQCAANVQRFCERLNFATPLAGLLAAFQADPGSAQASAPRHLREVDAPPSTLDREIEEELLREGAQPPPADETVPPLVLGQHEPGRGVAGKWLAWTLAAFMLLGSLRWWFEGRG